MIKADRVSLRPDNKPRFLLFLYIIEYSYLFSFSENLDELGGALLILLGEECVSRPFVVAPASPPDPVKRTNCLYRTKKIPHFDCKW